MVPFFALCISFVVFFLAGRLGVTALLSWRSALRWALAVMFLLTASAHFNSMRADLVRMVPPAFPAPELLVTVTGVLEILGAIGLVVPRLARPAAVSLSLLLVAMFPANVHAAAQGVQLGGAAATALLPRTILQLIFVGALLLAGFGSAGRGAGRRSEVDGAARPRLER